MAGTVEIKKAVADVGVETMTANASPDVLCHFIGDADLQRCIPEAHVGKVIQ